MRRVLVTGGCGFIGSHLCAALRADGDAVVVLDNLSSGKVENLAAGARLVVGDATDSDRVKALMAEADCCFHLAAIASVARSVEQWPDTSRVNLGATIAVLDAAAPRRVPVVYASSAAVYGNCADLPLGEASATRPLTPYGADKLANELHARCAGYVHGVATVGLRLFNVFGAGQDPSSPYSGVISIFADRLMRGDSIVVHGDGGQTRDFIHVSDVVRAFIAAMERAEPQAPVFNVCSGRATSILDLAGSMADLAGRTDAIVMGPPRPGDIRASIGDPRSAAARLEFSATKSLRQGLAETFPRWR